AKLVGVVMDEPVRVDLARDRGLALQDSRPIESIVGVRAVSQRLDGEEAAAEEALDGGDGAVCRSIVQEVDLDALLDQISDNLLDDVRFVVRGDDRDNLEARRHAEALYPSLRALPGEGAHHRLPHHPELPRQPAIVVKGSIALVLDRLGEDGPEEVLSALQ